MGALKIEPVKKKITVTVSACVPGMAEFEAVLRKIPGVSSFLDDNKIAGGCIELGYGSYNWGYQRLELVIHPLCSPPLGPFKACAGMQLYWRIKAGGIYPAGEWGDRDISSGRATPGCQKSDATQFQVDNYKTNQNVGPPKCYFTSACVDPYTFWQGHANWFEPPAGWQEHYFKSEEVCKEYVRLKTKRECSSSYTIHH